MHCIGSSSLLYTAASAKSLCLAAYTADRVTLPALQSIRNMVQECMRLKKVCQHDGIADDVLMYCNIMLRQVGDYTCCG